MWNRLLWGVAFALAASFSGTSWTRAAEPVKKVGNIYEKAVCAHGVARGEARCFSHVRVDATGVPIIFDAGKNGSNGSNGKGGKGGGGGGGKGGGGGSTTSPLVPYKAADLQGAYNIHNTSAPSTGPVTVAIVDAYGYKNAEQDLDYYRSYMGLPPCNGCFTKLNQNGNPGPYPPDNTGWATETALDLDMVSAMCPTCNIVLVEADDANIDNLAQAVKTAASIPGVVAISNSYGTAESNIQGDTYTPTQLRDLFYNNPGIAITVSSGDSGYGVEFPADIDTVIAVGGTSLNYTGPGTTRSETAWSGAGSGCSAIYHQANIAQTAIWQDYSITQCGTGNDALMRMGVDISAVADPNTGVMVYGPTGIRSPLLATGWMQVGGTSVSAPLIAGMYGANGGPTGNWDYPAEGIWENALNGQTADLADITSGSNGSCGTFWCQSVAGYDGPTGWGSPTGLGVFAYPAP